MQKLKFKITNINIMYEDDDINVVEVYFNTEDPDRYVVFSGHIPFTKAEYEADSSFNGLINVIKAKVADKI